MGDFSTRYYDFTVTEQQSRVPKRNGQFSTGNQSIQSIDQRVALITSFIKVKTIQVQLSATISHRKLDLNLDVFGPSLNGN